MMRKNPLKQDQKNLVSNAEKYLDDLQSVSMIYKVSGLTESVRLVYLVSGLSRKYPDYPLNVLYFVNAYFAKQKFRLFL